MTTDVDARPVEATESGRSRRRVAIALIVTDVAGLLVGSFRGSRTRSTR
jgi:hypothetical protein